MKLDFVIVKLDELVDHFEMKIDVLIDNQMVRLPY